MKLTNIISRSGKALLAGAFALAATAGMSAATFRGIQVSKTDGSTVTVPIATNLETTVNADGEMVFAKGAEQLLAVPMTQMSGWRFLEEAGTTAISATDSEAGAKVIGNLVVIEGLAGSTIVSVVDASGRAVISERAESRCELSLDALTPGVYVIVYGNQTLKIAVR
ncbi:MAG: hypothetical protein NC210_03785 [[Clostridium] fimetarium]|nr:hypothetical protein [Alistipes timonensis]MCM1405525.1 hypothetical protein [[Clostridium] fimetarium]